QYAATSILCACCMLVNHFFFSSRRRHTRFSRDWSSDVCSSDLTRGYGKYALEEYLLNVDFYLDDVDAFRLMAETRQPLLVLDTQIGRASCRERVYLWLVAIRL